MHKIAITLVLMIFNSFGSLYAMNIWEASRTGNIEAIKQLIEQDSTKVNARTPMNTTPLYYASYNGHTEIAALLLQHNADVNAQDDDKLTPLHIAAWGGYSKAVTSFLLLDNAKHCASEESYTKTIKLLLSYGATPHKPINLFVKYPHYSQTYAQRYESWICKTFVSRKTIVFLLSLIGRKQITDTPLLPKDMRNLIASYYAISDQEREREESSQNPNSIDPVREWKQFKKDNPNMAVLARIELP